MRHGHRRSVDFDFFRTTSFDPQELMLTLDGAFRNVERLPTGEQTLYVRLLQHYSSSANTKSESPDTMDTYCRLPTR